MRPFLILKLEILFQPLANFSQTLISFRINLLVFYAPPEPFDEYIVQCPALAEASDQKVSIAHWCAEQNINYNNFLYWRERFRSNSTLKVDRAYFQELVQSPAFKGIVLECNQVRIQLSENFDAATLRKCLQVLKEGVC